MDIELIEIRRISRRGAAVLRAAARRSMLPKRLSVRYLRRGSDFPPRERRQPAFMSFAGARSRRRTVDDRLLERLGGATSMAATAGRAPAGR